MSASSLRRLDKEIQACRHTPDCNAGQVAHVTERFLEYLQPRAPKAEHIAGVTCALMCRTAEMSRQTPWERARESCARCQLREGQLKHNEHSRGDAFDAWAWAAQVEARQIDAEESCEHGLPHFGAGCEQPPPRRRPGRTPRWGAKKVYEGRWRLVPHEGATLSAATIMPKCSWAETNYVVRSPMHGI